MLVSGVWDLAESPSSARIATVSGTFDEVTRESGGIVAPRNSTESTIISVWADVLAQAIKQTLEP
eukprot:3768921-Amphidinium_carterae.1